MIRCDQGNRRHQAGLLIVSGGENVPVYLIARCHEHAQIFTSTAEAVELETYVFTVHEAAAILWSHRAD